MKDNENALKPLVLAIWSTNPAPGSPKAPVCLTAGARSVLLPWVATESPEVAPLVEETLENCPVVVPQLTLLTLKVWLVPKAVAVAPVTTVHPVGSPVPMPLKFSLYGELVRVT